MDYAGSKKVQDPLVTGHNQVLGRTTASIGKEISQVAQDSGQ